MQTLRAGAADATFGLVLHWVDDNEFAIGETTFELAVVKRFKSSRERFLLVKPRWMVEHYLELFRNSKPQHIVELGICEGGSTAFFAHVAQPRRLVAVELRPEPSEALEYHLDEQGLRDRVATYYGVDQADRARLRSIVEREFPETPLDLVVDDASHLVDETRSSFNILFPRLRPGGSYLIEDWSWGLSSSWLFPDGIRPDSTPLAAFVCELIVACGSSPGLIEDIVISRGLATVRRGDEAVDPDTFDLSDCYEDRGRDLLTIARGSR